MIILKKSSQTKRQPSISGAEMPNLLRPQKCFDRGIPDGHRVEALIGYLYLSGRTARALELIKIGLDVGENE